MFGSGLPVLALNFLSIGELVLHDKNGLVFNNDEELAQQMINLLEDGATLERYSKYLVDNRVVFQSNQLSSSSMITCF